MTDTLHSSKVFNAIGIGGFHRPGEDEDVDVDGTSSPFSRKFYDLSTRLCCSLVSVP